MRDGVFGVVTKHTMFVCMQRLGFSERANAMELLGAESFVLNENEKWSSALI